MRKLQQSMIQATFMLVALLSGCDPEPKDFVGLWYGGGNTYVISLDGESYLISDHESNMNRAFHGRIHFKLENGELVNHQIPAVISFHQKGSICFENKSNGSKAMLHSIWVE